eukprot:jgi/Mesen1/1774/ME000014S01180
MAPSGSSSDGAGPLVTAAPGRVKFPATVWYIVGNEFCERFSFYGMRTILALYLKDSLQLSNNGATEAFHLFIVASYCTPLLGAFLSDSFIGKYKTIFYLSIVYCLGNWTVAFSATRKGVGAGLGWAVLGLGLIALGTGGIKPCVSAFGGDQVEAARAPGPGREQLVRVFFSTFYFAINAGATLSTLVTPVLRSSFSYAAAFAAPAVLMLVALFVFWSGRAGYVHRPPAGNIITEVAAIVRSALAARRAQTTSSSSSSSLSTAAAAASGTQRSNGFSKVPTTDADDNDAAVAAALSAAESGSSGNGEQLEVSTLPEGAAQPLLPERRGNGSGGSVGAGAARKVAVGAAAQKPHWLDAAKPAHGAGAVEDVKQLWRVLALFVPMPVFWSLFDQQSSRWVFQAEQMDGRLFWGLRIQPDQMQVMNSVLILVMIPLFDRIIYPGLERAGVRLLPLRRMVTGMLLCALAFVISGLLQIWIDSVGQPNAATSSFSFPAAAANHTFSAAAAFSEVPRTLAALALPPGAAAAGEQAPLCGVPGSSACVSMLWQVPQYVVITAGEILFSITGLELAYSQAPASMTSVVQSCWMLTDAVGNLVTVLVVGTIGPLLTQTQEFFFFSVGCLLAMISLLYIGQGFAYVESVAADNDTSVPTPGDPRRSRSLNEEEQHALATLGS